MRTDDLITIVDNVLAARGSSCLDNEAERTAVRDDLVTAVGDRVAALRLALTRAIAVIDTECDAHEIVVELTAVRDGRVPPAPPPEQDAAAAWTQWYADATSGAPPLPESPLAPSEDDLRDLAIALGLSWIEEADQRAAREVAIAAWRLGARTDGNTKGT